jgi:hypothetical protein
LFKKRGLEEEIQKEIGYDSTATYHIDETKIKRSFHKCKYQRKYFYFLQKWEKTNALIFLKPHTGKGLPKISKLSGLAFSVYNIRNPGR